MKKKVHFLFILVGVLTLSQSCTVIENSNNACFSAEYDTYYVGEAVQFTNCSNPADSYEWDFGDGYYSEELQPQHVFTQSGVYNVILTVFYGTEQKTSTLQVTVIGTCFSTQYNNYSVDEAIQFTNCSDPADRYDWDFGDGYYSSDFQPIHVFSRAGVYNVTLIAYYGNQTATYSLSITIVSPVTLRIIAYYEGTSDFIAGADAILYGSLQDWQQDTNRMASGITNGNGEIIFGVNSGITLYNQNYYIYVSKEAGSGYYSNQATQYTTPILQNGVNDFEVDLRFFPSKKKKNRTKFNSLRRSQKISN